MAREVNALAGIVNVRFDMGTKVATVTYDPSAADPDSIRAAIDRANRSMASDENESDDAGRVLG